MTDMKNTDRKIIASFPTLLEAEAAVTALEASGIDAIVNNEITGSMMPHASNAFGGFHVSVDAEKEAEARSLLEGASPEEKFSVEPESLSRQMDQVMRRATYGAVMGCMFLPVIANIFSLLEYRRAYRMSSAEFWKRKWLLLMGMVFNTLCFAVAIHFARSFFRS